MSDIPEGGGEETPRDDISESSGDVELSDPGSETSSLLDEEVHAADEAAEEEFRDAQENYSVGDPHAEYHAAEEALYASRQPQSSTSEQAPSDFASAADVLDDSELDPASHQHTESVAPAGNGNGHGNNGNGAPDDAEQADVVGDHEQTPAVPALTAESQEDAALPSIEAVSGSQTEDLAAVSSSAGQQQETEHNTRADSVHDPQDSDDDSNAPHSDSEEAVREPAPLSRLPSLPGYAEPSPEPQEEEQPALEPVAEEQLSSAADASKEEEHTEDTQEEQTLVEETRQENTEQAESAPRAKLPSLPAYARSASEHDDEEEQQDEEAQPAAQPAESSPEVQRLVQQAMSQASGSSAPSADAPAHASESEEATVSTSVEQESSAAPASAPTPAAARQPDEATAADPVEVQPDAPAHAVQAEDAILSTSVQDAPVSAAPAAAAAAASAVATETSSSSSDRQPRGLGKLPVRKGPVRQSGSSSTPAASSQQEAVPPPSAASSDHAPQQPPTTPAVANNGHSQAGTSSSAATAGNGAATSSTTTSNNGDSPPQRQHAGRLASESVPAPQPAAASANPSSNAGAAGPRMPPREPAGNANPSGNAGGAGPRIPPRQPAGNGQAGPAAAAAAAAQPAEEDEDPEHRELREKVQSFRVLLVRLAHRLRHNVRSNIVQQVNYRLDLAERIRLSGNPRTNLATGRYGFEVACNTADQLETRSSTEHLGFTCTVMVIGMSGVGKSATINSILQKDSAAPTSAYKLGTHGIRVVVGDVYGVRVRFIDTPGLQPGAGLTGRNARLLNAMHSAHKKYKPDIMLYTDRADVFRTDQADVPLLRAITESFGPSTWFNTILALTHAAAAPPDGNAGPISYETYTRTRTQLLQQNISYFRRQASGDMRLLNPVALVENHPSCRTNDEGLAILPNQLAWKQHLTLLLLSSKLLADTDSLLKIQQDSSAQDSQRRAMRMLLSGRKMPPIPYLIAGFIQKKSPKKPPDEERAFRHDAELKDLSTMDRKDEMRRRREYSRMRAEEAKAEAGATQAGVPAPDIPLQPTFDGDDTTHRYRYMEPGPDAPLCRPVVDPNGLDHDDGMTAFTVEKSSVVRKPGVYVGGAPAYLMAQVHKDKDAFTVISEAEASYYHTHKMISTASLEAQTVQADALFTTKLETRYKMHPKNKTAAGILLSRLKEDGGLPTKGPIVYGGKIEDRYKASDKLKVVVATATLMNKPEQARGPKEQAWNHSAEVRFKAGEDDKCLVSLSGNNMRFHGKSGYGGGASVQYSHSKDTTAAGSLQLNSERTGKINMRVTSHDHPKLGFSLLVPVVGMIWGKIRGRD